MRSCPAAQHRAVFHEFVAAIRCSRRRLLYQEESRAVAGELGQVKRELDHLGLVYEDRTNPIPDEVQPATMLISSYSETDYSPFLFGIIGGTYKNVYRAGDMIFGDGHQKDWKWLIEDVPGAASMINKPGWFNCPLDVAQKAYITASLKGIIIHDSTHLESIGGFEFFPTWLKAYHAKLSLIMTS